jgi:monoamine oxidase
MSFSRRSFLAASAAFVAAPAFGQVPASGAVDVIIVGAGAAGIAAARKIAPTGKRVVLVEASDRIGGRCFTDTRSFGMPYDRGAHSLHSPDVNPLAKLARGAGLEVYPAPPGQKLRIGRRNGREGELEDFLASLVRANRAISDVARGKSDVAAAAALPKTLGEWRNTVEFMLGPYACGKDLTDISAADLAKSADRDVNAYCRQGLGALLVKLAEGIPLRLSAPVRAIDSFGRGRVEVQTSVGTLTGRFAIVTVSTNILAASKIRFLPELPKRQQEAAAKLTLSSYDRVALELDGNPLGLDPDDLVFEKSEQQRTAAMLANVSGSSLVFIDVGGKFGRDLAAQGEPAMVAFATDWLANLYGNEIKKAVKRSHATRWNQEPWVLGAMSAAPPGAQPLRKVLMEPVRDRVFFAGEAAHETLWGTVDGAWESGERAATEVLKRMGIGLTPRTSSPAPRRERQQRQRQPTPANIPFRDFR